MELEQYYKLNRVFLSMIGLWPYDNLKVRRVRFILTLLTSVLYISPQLIKLCVSKYNFDLLLQILPFSIVSIGLSMKYVTIYVKIKNIKEFQERLQSNWSALIDKQEIEILRKQAIIGKLFTITIAIFSYGAFAFIFFLQYNPILLDFVMPLNESRPREFIIPAEYFIDQQKYFPIITIQAGIGLFSLLTTAITAETFSFTNALHAFGLFKVASYRVKHTLNKTDSQMCITRQYIIFRHRIIAAVDFHRRAIEYSELLKTSFGEMYLILLVVMVCSGSINLLNFSRLMATEKILDMTKTILFITVCLLYLTFANYAGQKFIDYDTHLYRTICNMKWYNAPLKTQQLIYFLIQKTTKCYKVDAGGMFIPCFEGLATSLSMIISYFMVLSSV